MSLLKDAILETKEVKAMALANAKMVLEETFQPSLQRLVSSKIAEEEGDDDESSMDNDINIGSEEEPAVGFGGGDEDLETYDDMDDELDEIFEEEWSEDEIEEAVRSFMESDDMDDELDEIFEEEEMDDELDEIFEEEEMDFEDSELEEEFDEDEIEEIFESSRYSGRNERELKRIKAKLNEALRSNVIYKKAINEVNLLNAKLMYSQKIMQEFDFSKEQKVKVLESFDRANTVREVQGKYRDIVSLMNVKKSYRTINEGAASKPIRQMRESITRLDESVKRYQVLAGLKPAYE